MLSEWVSRSDAGYAGLLMSAEDFLALGETDDRYELVNGVVVMSPSPTPQHWGFVEEAMDQVKAFAKPRGGFEIYAETDLLVGPSMVFRPDLCVYARPRPKKRPRRLVEPPDVVLEVNSPGNKSYDFVTKREAYERLGVREYWSIDPCDPSEPSGLRVRAWRLERGRFTDLEVGTESLVSRAIEGFVLDLRPLREMAGE